MENMNNDTAEQQGNEQQENSVQGKTFTQEDVNRIVQERLARVKATPEPDERELELQRREADLYLREAIAKNDLPADVYEGLKGIDKETIDKCIKVFAPYILKSTEPILNPVVGPTGGYTGTDPIRRAMGLK